jgi:hypothetical protein
MERRYTTRTEYYWSRDTTTYPVQAQADNLLWRAYARLAFEGIGAELRPLTDDAHSLCERTRLACPHWRNATGGNSPYFTPCTNVIKALDPEGLHGARIIWPLEWATKIDADESLSRHIPKPKVLWNPQDGELKAYEFLEWVCDGRLPVRLGTVLPPSPRRRHLSRPLETIVPNPTGKSTPNSRTTS